MILITIFIIIAVSVLSINQLDIVQPNLEVVKNIKSEKVIEKRIIEKRTLTCIEKNKSTQHDLEFDSNELVQLINEERVKNNLDRLVLNGKLEEAACLKVNDMFDNNYFEHVSPAGVDPWHWFRKVNYVYSFAGENLAKNYFRAGSAHKELMLSKLHRENILNEDFKEIGIAVKYGEFGNSKTIIVVQLFGDR